MLSVVCIYAKRSWPLRNSKLEFLCQDLFTRVVCHQLTGKQKRKTASSSKVKAVFEESHVVVTRHIAEEAPNILSEVNAFRSDEGGGNLNV